MQRRARLVRARPAGNTLGHKHGGTGTARARQYGNNRRKERQAVTQGQSIEVGKCISCRLAGRVRDLHIEFDGNGLILRGRVQTYYAKQLVQHQVMEATGLPIRVNDIEVL